MPWGESWSEQDLIDLAADEHSYQEFKATPFIEKDGAVAPGFLGRLSKQVSAFANGNGGWLFLGIDDRGNIDGGVSMDLKGGGVRSWLEDVVPGCVEPQLVVFNVYEVARGGPGSHIEPGKAVYVVEIPPSHDAPHQAIDYRYYLRIAGKSRPMGHLNVQDVSRRVRTPRVELQRIAPFGTPELVMDDPRGPKVILSFNCHIANAGRVLAQHVGGEFILPRVLVGRELRQRMLADEVEISQRPGQIHVFRYRPQPLFPGQDTVLLRCWVGLHAGNADAVRLGHAALGWRIYADDAEARQGERALNTYGVVRDALHWLARKQGPTT